MKQDTPGLIIKKIQNTIGKGPHVLHEPTFCGNELKYLKESIKKNFVSTSGPFVKKFEKKIKDYTKSKYPVAVINGTQALFIALKILGIKNNEEVLVPALTFVGTVNAISYLGADPHFIDSKINNFGIDCKKLDIYLKKIIKFVGKKSVNKLTGKTIKAIVPVHIFGHPCDMQGVIKIAKKYNLRVVEDAAEGLGSFYKKKHLGTFGDVGCISFNGNKIITSGGGGVILTNNKKLANQAKHFVTTAKTPHKWEYIHDNIGYNFKMPSINAALGLAQIEKINFFLNAKKKLYEKYKEQLGGIEGVTLYKAEKYSNSNYWLQTIILDSSHKYLKEKILSLSYKKKIYMRPVWKLISDLKPYMKKQKMNLSGAKEIYDRAINLPSSQSLILKRK
jgi:perosamine synthetase